MNDQMLNKGFLSGLLQQAVWLEWLQPFLYGLLAIALVSLVIALLDLATLCWKASHAAETQETTKPPQRRLRYAGSRVHPLPR